MESSEQISTNHEPSLLEKILAQGIENFSLRCVICTKPVPLKRAKSRSKDTCSPECNTILKKFRRYIMLSGHCPACYHPSSPEERADYIKWRKQRGDRRDRPGRPPKAEPKTKKPSDEDLRNVLTRYEGSVCRVERDGDDSDEAVKEMESAREELLAILRIVRTLVETEDGDGK